MKKIVSLIITLALLFTCVISASAETDFKEIDANLTNLLNSAIIEEDYAWHEEELLRGLLSLCLFYDVENKSSEDIIETFGEGLTDGDIYFGKANSGKNVFYSIFVRGSESTLVMLYTPAEEEAEYAISNYMSKSSIKSFLDSQDMKYWELDDEDIANAMDALENLI